MRLILLKPAASLISAEVVSVELELWRNILDVLEIEKDIKEVELSQGGSGLVTIAEIRDFIYENKPSKWVVQNWFLTSGGLTVGALWLLVDKVGCNRLRNEAWSKFRLEVSEYFKHI